MNIFVAKLDYNTSVETVQALFEQFGEVTSAKVIMDRETGRSKGFGFVEMANEEEGQNAIDALDGTEVDGREIVCKKSEPRENKGRGNRRDGGGYQKRYDNRDNRGGYNRDRRDNRYDRRDNDRW